MGNAEEKEQSEKRLMDVNDIPAVGSSLSENHPATTLWPQAGGGRSATYRTEVDSHSGGAETPVSPYVYAIGRVQVRYPSLGIEKEIAQVTRRAGTTDLTNQAMLQKVLSLPDNRYLVRQLCWVLTIEGLEHYILQPRDPVDLHLLMEAIRPAPKLADIDIVIGVRGPLAPPEMCNGLVVPIVAFDLIYPFDVDHLVKSIPRPRTMTAEKFEPAAEELLMRIIQMADNAGATDEHRALNYLAVRYTDIYTKAVEAYAQNSSLTALDVRPSRLGSVRKVFDVIFSFTNRQTDVIEKFFVRVDVTEEFPFLVTKLSPYYDR